MKQHPRTPVSRLWRRLRWPEIIAVATTGTAALLIATGYTDRMLSWML